MTIDISHARSATLAIPAAVVTAVAFIAGATLFDFAPKEAGMRMCDHTGQAITSASVSQSGKVRAEAEIISIAAPAHALRMRAEPGTVIAQEATIAFTRCTPGV